MIISTYIGSGDIHSLMMGKETAGYLKLLQRFVSNETPYYNAKQSPIDALRTGAILEERFFLTLADCWQYQYFVQSTEMDVFKATLDFAQLHDGKVVDFIELKTMSFDDYIRQVQPIRESNDDMVAYVKKKHKEYYQQVQEQLYCTGLDSAWLVFLCVTTYDDDENYQRDIKDDEYTMVRIERDDETIAAIKQRGEIFQTIKNHFKEK